MWLLFEFPNEYGLEYSGLLSVASLGLGSDGDRKNELAVASCRGTGLLCVLLPQLGRGLALPEPGRLLGEILAASVLLLLPSLVKRFAIPSWILNASTLLVLLASLVTGTWGWGWPPGAVLTISLLTALCGLLVGRLAVVAIIAAEGLALSWGARNISVIALEKTMDRIDPGVFMHWLQFAAMFAATATVLATVLKKSAGHVGRALNEAQSDQIAARSALEASRKLRGERIAAELRLRDSQKLQALAQLSGGFAHMLNNALMVTCATMEELEASSAQPVRERAEVSITEVTHKVAEAIRKLLLFSRRDLEYMPRLDIQAELEKIAKTFQVTLLEDIELNVRGANRQWSSIEESGFKQLIFNLLLNAADALPHGGQIWITLLDPRQIIENGATFVSGSSHLQIMVEDNGEGMPSDSVEQARDAFYTTKSRGVHAGLGLTVASGIAEQAGGSLQVHSAPGKGTRIAVLLPCTHSGSENRAISLMHGKLAEPWPSENSSLSTALEPEPIVSDDEAHNWKEEMSRRLARRGWFLVVAAFVVVTVIKSNLQLEFLALCGYGWSFLGLGLAGWSRRLSSETRTVFLVSGVLGMALIHLSLSSYLMAGLVVCLLLGVSWSALLASVRTTILVIVALTLALVLIALVQPLFQELGNSFGGYFYAPGNWQRLAVVLPIAHTLLGLSVFAILRDAQRATVKAVRAEQEMKRAQLDEKREGRKKLAAERETSRSERLSATGQAVSAVAHDLNNALQGLIGPATLLSDTKLTEEQIEVLKKELNQGFQYASGFSAQFSVGDDNFSGELPPLRLAQAICNSVGTMQALVGKRYRLDVQCSGTEAVALSESSLRRILFNLVTNARDALGDSGAIGISLKRVDQNVVLTVVDQGRGMDEQLCSRVTEPFFTTKGKGKGTGLGLHSVASLVAQSGGALRIDSNVGQGTKVTICWPYIEPLESNTPIQSHVASRQGSNAGTILLVEDEPRILVILSRILARAGYRVLSANSGDTAMRLLDETESCVALCIDGIIPGVSSRCVMDQFRRRNPNSPIILCSGHLPSQLRARGLLTNCSATLLTKPFAPNQLCRLLERLIGDVS